MLPCPLTRRAHGASGPGGKVGSTETEHRFPGLVALLEKIAEERRVRAKSVGHGTTAEVELPADPDPRWKPLKEMGQACCFPAG